MKLNSSKWSIVFLQQLIIGSIKVAKGKEECSETSTFAVTLDWPGIPNSSSSSSSSSIRST
jgi:hypothetical protein